MIRYGSVSLPCTEEEKTKMHFNYVHHMTIELVHLQWLLGIPYNTVKLTMQFFFFFKNHKKIIYIFYNMKIFIKKILIN